MTERSFPITVTAQMRHGLLWEARARAGSSTALAELLGVHPSRLGTWINFKYQPSRKWWDAQGVQIEAKLSRLLNRPVTYGDIFPEELQSEEFRRAPKRREVTHDVPLDKLIEAGAAPKALLSPSGVELRADVNTALELSELNPRHRLVIQRRFGLDGGGEATFEDIAEELGVTRERVRQMEAKALRILRHPSHSKHLKPYMSHL